MLTVSSLSFTRDEQGIPTHSKTKAALFLNLEFFLVSVVFGVVFLIEREGWWVWRRAGWQPPTCSCSRRRGTRGRSRLYKRHSRLAWLNCVLIIKETCSMIWEPRGILNPLYRSETHVQKSKFGHKIGIIQLQTPSCFLFTLVIFSCNDLKTFNLCTGPKLEKYSKSGPLTFSSKFLFFWSHFDPILQGLVHL